MIQLKWYYNNLRVFSNSENHSSSCKSSGFTIQVEQSFDCLHFSTCKHASCVKIALRSLFVTGPLVIQSTMFCHTDTFKKWFIYNNLEAFNSWIWVKFVIATLLLRRENEARKQRMRPGKKNQRPEICISSFSFSIFYHFHPCLCSRNFVTAAVLRVHFLPLPPVFLSLSFYPPFCPLFLYVCVLPLTNIPHTLFLSPLTYDLLTAQTTNRCWQQYRWIK